MGIACHTASRCRPAMRWLPALAPLFLFCSDSDNPFSDLTNATVHVAQRTFGTVAEGDSLEIFTTYAIEVVVALREEVDSFCVVAPSNRFGDTITFRSSPAAPFEPVPYAAQISLTDTGLADIRIVTYRSSGEAVVQTLRVRAVSPLRQSPLTGMYGDTLTLATDSVGDRDVYYHWWFGTYSSVRSAYPFTRAAVPLTVQQQGDGLLWVADLRDERRSPAIPFSFAFNDTSPPVITLALTRPTFAGTDTILTGDSVFAFKVRIEDPGAGHVEQALVNNVSFDEQDGAVFVRRIADMQATLSTDPLALEVAAVDGFGNQARRTFWALYSDTVQRTQDFEFRLIVPLSGHSTSPSQDLPVIALLRDHAGDSVDAVVTLTVNGSVCAPITARGGAEGALFSTHVILTLPSDTIRISVSDTLRGHSLDTTLVVQYVPSASDTTAPVIADVSWNGKDIRPKLIVDHRPIDLRVIAFDQGSGIDTLWINGVSLSAMQNQDYLWTHTVTPVHAPAGTVIDVYARDHDGNTAEAQGAVVYNRRPQVTDTIGGVTVRARQQWRDTLAYYDPDGDAVALMLYASPPGVLLSGREVSWTPSDNDTGSNVEITLRLDDGYEVAAYACTLQVLPAQNAPCSLSMSSDIGTMEGNVLTIDDTSGPVTIRFAIYDQDPRSIDNHTVTVIHGGMVTTTAADTARSVSVVINPAKAVSSRDTVTVIATDRAGAKDTVTLLVVLRTTTAAFSGRLVFDAAVLSSALTAPVANFPLLVRLAAPEFDFGADWQSGAAMRFAKRDGTPLPYQVDTWDSAGGTASVWVLVDTLYPGADSQWIGLAPATGAAPSKAVFDTADGFAGVWHLGPDLADATPGRGNGTNYGSADTAGVIGRARRFYLAQDTRVEVPHSSLLSFTGTVSLSAWILVKLFPTDETVGAWQAVVAKNDDTYRLQRTKGVNAMGFHANINGTPGVLGTVNVNDGRYHHVAGVLDSGGVARLYIDGVLDGADGPAGDSLLVITNTEPVTIGDNLFQTDRNWDGVIDEVRVARRPHSAQWIRLCFETQKPGSRFVTLTRINP